MSQSIGKLWPLFIINRGHITGANQMTFEHDQLKLQYLGLQQDYDRALAQIKEHYRQTQAMQGQRDYLLRTLSEIKVVDTLDQAKYLAQEARRMIGTGAVGNAGRRALTMAECMLGAFCAILSLALFFQIWR